METQELFTEVVPTLPIEFQVQKVKSRPDRKSVWDRQARHFLVTITRSGLTGTSEVWFYSQGSGHTKNPTLIDVMSSLVMDASYTDESFESWAANYGYNSDSISDLKLYEECKGSAERLKDVLGPDIYNRLLACEMNY